MVVKEKRGRKRYILFTHPENFSKDDAYHLFKELLTNLKNKINWKIIRFDNNEGILLVDHKMARQARELIKEKGLNHNIKTKKTSGTIKALMK